MRPSNRIAIRSLQLASLAVLLGGCDTPDRALSLEPTVPAPGAAILVADLAQTQGFRKAVALERIRAHQEAFQQIADANGGIRSTGSPGFAATVDYVRDAMIAAGYDVTVQSFQFTVTGDRTPPVFQTLVPVAQTFVNRVDFATLTNSGSGDVTDALYAVDLLLPISSGPPDIGNSGCEAADFANFPPGAVALVRRGTCDFGLKALNAQAAGARAVIIMNTGTPGATGLIPGTLGTYPVTIPVIGVTYAIGLQLAGGISIGSTGLTVRVRTDWGSEEKTSWNVIADTQNGDPGSVVVVGASIDGGDAGPAINATSGAATLLEIARAFTAQERTPTNRLRFAFFGAQNQGAVGADHYVTSLSGAELARIRAMLAIEMLGSPNYARFWIDGDGSILGSTPGGPGSAAIEQLFADYFATRTLAAEEYDGLLVTSAQPFSLAGVATGGVFSGIGTLKTAAQAALYGGTAGVPFDPCYGLACDTYDNVSLQGLDELSDAAAHGILLLSRRNFAKNPLATP